MVASELALGAVPRLVRARSSGPASFSFDVLLCSPYDERDAAAVEGRRVVVESVCARLRASAALVCSPCGDAAPDPLPLVVSCAPNGAGNGVCVAVALPDPPPPSIPGSTWALRIDRLALGGTSLLSPEGSLASPVPVLLDRRPPPGPVRPAGDLFGACRRCNLDDARRIMSGPPDTWSTEETDNVRRHAGLGGHLGGLQYYLPDPALFFAARLHVCPHRCVPRRRGQGAAGAARSTY